MNARTLTSILALGLLLGPTAAAQSPFSEPDDEDPAEDVDLTPYIGALVARFQQCLTEESQSAAEAAEATPGPDAEPPVEPTPDPPALDPAEPDPTLEMLEAPDQLPELDVQEELDNAMSAFALLLGRNREQGPCTADDDAALACAAEVATWSCGRLYSELEGAMSGSLGGAEPPAWATAYASAMGGKVIECFTEEAGQPPTDEQIADIETYQNLLAGPLGSAGAACILNEARFSECMSGVSLMSCEALAAQISSDASITVTAFMESCDGFLDCGF